MVDVPVPAVVGPAGAGATFTAADVSSAVGGGRFYASTGVSFEQYDLTGPVLFARATEPVTFGATGGGGLPGAGTAPLAAFNVTLCADPAHPGVGVTNVGCAAAAAAAADAAAPAAPPAAREIRLDLRALPASATAGGLVFARVQANVRRRYPIAAAPVPVRVRGSHLSLRKGGGWVFELGTDAAAADVREGSLLRLAGGGMRRPFLVAKVAADRRAVTIVSHFTDDDTGDMTPGTGPQGTTTIGGIVAGTNELVAERWGWLQPAFFNTTTMTAL
jgi:hypothetical protein